MKKKILTILVLCFCLFLSVQFADTTNAIVPHEHGTFSATEVLTTGDLESGNYYVSSFPDGGTFTVPAGKTVTICLNGQTLYTGKITIYGTLNIIDCKGTGTWYLTNSQYGFDMEDGSELNIDGGTYISGESESDWYWMIDGAGTVSLKNATFKAKSHIICAYRNQNVTIDSCVMTGKGDTNLQYGTFVASTLTQTTDSTFIIKNSTITAEIPLWLANNIIEITDTKLITKGDHAGLEIVRNEYAKSAETYLKNVEVNSIYICSGVHVSLEGNNKIDTITLSVSDESSYTTEAKIGDLYLMKPVPMTLKGEITNTSPIGIKIYEFENSYSTPSYTEVTVVDNFDTVMPGKSYSNYFKAVYSLTPTLLVKEEGQLKIGKFAFTKNATNEDQSVEVNAEGAKYQWYKVTEKEKVLSETDLNSMMYGSWQGDGSNLWSLDEMFGTYTIYTMGQFYNNFSRIKVIIPKNSILYSTQTWGGYSPSGVPKYQGSGAAYQIIAAEPFSVTIKVKHNGGEWETLTDENVFTGNEGTYSNGVWNSVLDDSGENYIINAVSNYLNEPSGEVVYQITAVNDIVGADIECEKGTTNYIYYSLPVECKVRLVGTSYTYTKDSGNTSAKNNPSSTGTYVCKVTLGDAVLQSDMVEVTSVKKNNNTTTTKKVDPEYEIPTNLKATEGDTLESVTLPEGFTFQDSLTTLVGNEGENEFLVTFTPSDLSKYNVVKDIKVSILVEKAVEPEPEPEPVVHKSSKWWIYAIGAAVIIFFIIILLRRRDDDDEEEKKNK